MRIISDFFYYVFIASTVMIYGIGLNRSIMISERRGKIFSGCLKLFISVSASSALTYIVASRVLVPVALAEIFPFAAVLVFSTVSIFIESVVGITSKNSMSEYSLALLSVLLGVNESTSIVESVLISCFCIVSFMVGIFALAFLRRKFDNKIRLVVASIAIILVILLFTNVSWFAQGVYSR